MKSWLTSGTFGLPRTSPLPLPLHPPPLFFFQGNIIFFLYWFDESKCDYRKAFELEKVDLISLLAISFVSSHQVQWNSNEFTMDNHNKRLDFERSNQRILLSKETDAILYNKHITIIAFILHSWRYNRIAQCYVCMAHYMVHPVCVCVCLFFTVKKLQCGQ